MLTSFPGSVRVSYFLVERILGADVTNVYGKPTDKREKSQRRINDPFTNLLIVYIIQELEEAIPKVQ